LGMITNEQENVALAIVIPTATPVNLADARLAERVFESVFDAMTLFDGNRRPEDDIQGVFVLVAHKSPNVSPLSCEPPAGGDGRLEEDQDPRASLVNCSGWLAARTPEQPEDCEHDCEKNYRGRTTP